MQQISPEREDHCNKCLHQETSQRQREFLKTATEKQCVTYKGTPIRGYVDFSVESLQVRRQWIDIFKILKEKTVNQEYYSWQSSPSEK